jgi:competence protein ComGC
VFSGNIEMVLVLLTVFVLLLMASTGRFVIQ